MLDGRCLSKRLMVNAYPNAVVQDGDHKSASLLTSLLNLEKLLEH